MFDCGSLLFGEVASPLVNSYSVGVVPAGQRLDVYMSPFFDHVGSDTALCTEHHMVRGQILTPKT